jgi:hypothetical protein
MKNGHLPRQAGDRHNKHAGVFDFCRSKTPVLATAGIKWMDGSPGLYCNDPYLLRAIFISSECFDLPNQAPDSFGYCNLPLHLGLLLIYYMFIAGPGRRYVVFMQSPPQPVTGQPNTFRLYFGMGGSYVGTAKVKVTLE